MGHVPREISTVCLWFIRGHRIDYCMSGNVLQDSYVAIHMLVVVKYFSVVFSSFNYSVALKSN